MIILLTATAIFYFAIKNYRRWRKLITNDTESSSPSAVVQLSSTAVANENSVTVERDDSGAQIESIVAVPRELSIEIESKKMDDEIVASANKFAKTNTPLHEQQRNNAVDRADTKLKKNIFQVPFELEKKHEM